MGAASMTMSCICASLSLTWPAGCRVGAFPDARSSRSLLVH